MKLTRLDAIEILDSRGLPTLKVSVVVKGSKRSKLEARGDAEVPSGKSRGALEVTERRDNDPKKYFGQGVSKVADYIRNTLAKKLIGVELSSLAKFDRLLLSLDPTHDKHTLGGNVILGLSIAFSKALSALSDMPLYKVYRAEYDQLLKPGLRLGSMYTLPTPLFNIYNGGAHADNGISTQEFIVIPKGIAGFGNQVRAGVEIYQTLKQMLRLEKRTTGVGDEGGFSARWENDEQVLDLLTKAVPRAGYKLSRQISLGLDVAATQFFKQKDQMYTVSNFGRNGIAGDSRMLARHYWKWLAKYPIIYMEDIFAEEDWVGFAQFAEDMKTRKLGFYLVGDDLTVTRYERLEKAVTLGAINGIIIKPNQIGTLTETFETCALARLHDIELFVSHRSGETIDSFIADLAIGVGAGYIKAGAPCRGERVAKYNRLLEIEHELKS